MEQSSETESNNFHSEDKRQDNNGGHRQILMVLENWITFIQTQMFLFPPASLFYLSVQTIHSIVFLRSVLTFAV